MFLGYVQLPVLVSDLDCHYEINTGMLMSCNNCLILSIGTKLHSLNEQTGTV